MPTVRYGDSVTSDSVSSSLDERIKKARRVEANDDSQEQSLESSPDETAEEKPNE